MPAFLPDALLAEWINGTPANAARMLETLETPPLAHYYPVSPRVSSTRSERAGMIEPAASLGVFIQAGAVWGQLWGNCQFDFAYLVCESIA